MPLWLLAMIGITGVALVTHKPSGRGAAPVARRGGGMAPDDAPGFNFPGGASGQSDGFPVYGSATGDNASNAASLGLSEDEFAHMTDGGGNASAPSPLPPGIDSSGTQSEAASLGLSDDEYAHMTDTSGNASAPSMPSGGGNDVTDQSVDMGISTSTDVDPSAASFPGAEGTSVSGYHVGGPTETGAPPSWTDNADGTATDPTGLMTMSYSDAWDYYDLNAFGMGAPAMTNQGGGVNLPTQSANYDSEGNPFATVNGFRSYGEIHPSVGAPVVYDEGNNAYVMDGDGSVYPC